MITASASDEDSALQPPAPVAVPELDALAEAVAVALDPLDCEPVPLVPDAPLVPDWAICSTPAMAPLTGHAAPA
ncbi:MAG: hypothetical protein ACREF0_13360 [Acetobacteraceae bacterium]